MKTDNGLAIAFFAVVIGSAVALAIAHDIAAPICKAASEATPKDKFDFGCFEFFLNRYQTLFAAFVGAGVALFVVRPVFQQLKEMAKQSSKGAKEIAEAFAVAVDEEIAALQEIMHTAGWCNMMLHNFDMLRSNVKKTLRDDIVLQIDAIREKLAPVERNQRRQIADTAVVELRKAYIANTRELMTAARHYSVQMSIVVTSDQPNVRIRPIEHIRSVGKARFSRLPTLTDELTELLEKVSEAKWAQVRELERKAQGIDY